MNNNLPLEKLFIFVIAFYLLIARYYIFLIPLIIFIIYKCYKKFLSKKIDNKIEKYINENIDLLPEKETKKEIKESEERFHDINGKGREKLKYAISCHSCYDVFDVTPQTLQIEKNKNVDIAYAICPSCGEKIIIPNDKLYKIDFFVDFLGNILPGSDSYLISTIFYTTTCPYCKLPQHFTSRQVKRESETNKVYVIHSLNPTCEKRIYLTKDNTYMCRHPYDKPIILHS